MFWPPGARQERARLGSEWGWVRTYEEGGLCSSHLEVGRRGRVWVENGGVCVNTEGGSSHSSPVWVNNASVGVLFTCAASAHGWFGLRRGEERVGARRRACEKE